MILSIIVRCYNRLEYTIRSIVSIDLRSGLEKDQYEIICIDQNSTDGTVDWLKSVVNDGYYPIRPIFLEENIGDGLGMQMGIDNSRGEFIAQHDNDIEIVTKDYYYDLIRSYREFENIGYKVCSLGGSHVQGITPDSAPFRFARNAGKTNEISFLTSCFIPIAWNTASFVFRREFAEVSFDKRMCNSWGGEWFDRGYDHFISKSHLFWHIDSGESGAHVQKQYDKFRNYQYVKRHYRQFITEEGF